jgi:hypothetical protein
VPCPGGSGDLAGGCQDGALASLAFFAGGGFVSVVGEGLAGGEAGLTLEMVIKMVLRAILHDSEVQSTNDS